ncbi:hypothetical protein AB1Y20_002819 [Prymnesium parvum]|uniref:Uncharacterized protein n=1 Tax=Prymnesium parvum TaxID=97485 RepID=A0AB34JC91_PRYPA
MAAAAALNASRLDSQLFGGAAPPSPPPGCVVERASLAWSASLAAAAYSAPLLVPSPFAFPFASTRAYAATLAPLLEARHGENGSAPAGWPSGVGSGAFHGGPLLFDVDVDGADELLLVSFAGEVVFVRQEDGVAVEEAGFRLPKLRVRKRWYEEGEGEGGVDVREAVSGGGGEAGERREEEGGGGGGGEEGGGGEGGGWGEADVGAHGLLSAEAEASFGLFALDEAADGEALLGGEEKAARLGAWAAAFEDGGVLRRLDARGELLVDAHVLCGAALADVDGDGEEELLVGVSYFFEEGEAARLVRHGVVVERGKYVGGVVMAVEPRGGRVKWAVRLGLTTDGAARRAYIYSAPTVIDLAVALLVAPSG